MAREGLHYEPRWFSPWSKGKTVEISYGGFEGVRFGDVFYKIGDVGVAIEICEEAWGPESSIDSIAGSCELVLNLSASHFSMGKNDVRRRLVSDTSRALCVYYAYSNLLGVESGTSIYDGSTFIAFNGKIIAEGERFSYADYQIDYAPVDINLARVNKMRQYSSKIDGSSQFDTCCVKLSSFLNKTTTNEAFVEQPRKVIGKFAEFHNADAWAIRLR